MIKFIPHETKIFNDREPPWIDNTAKTVEEKNIIYQLYWKIKVYVSNQTWNTAELDIWKPGEL